VSQSAHNQTVAMNHGMFSVMFSGFHVVPSTCHRSSGVDGSWPFVLPWDLMVFKTGCLIELSKNKEAAQCLKL